MHPKSIGIICTSTGFGGLEMNTLKLCKWLADYGWNVRLLLNEASITFQKSGEYATDICTMQQYGSNKLSPSVIKQWLAALPVSILLTPYNKDIAAVSNYKRFKNKGIKLVYQQHMQVGVKKRDIIHTLRYNMLDLWISPLEYLKKETIEKTRVPAEKIKVIPLGLEPSRFLSNNIAAQDARRQLGLPEGKFIIGVLGRIDPKKGQDFLIRVLPELENDVHLVIAGDITPNEGEAYLDLLHELVNINNLSNRVHFIKTQKDITVFYSAIDVFAMPSHGETYGMVTLEAMLSGKPVIGVNRDGTKELLQHGKFGWLHQLEDKEDFRRKLNELRHSTNKDEIIRDARSEVLKNYTAEGMMKATDAALKSLIGK